MSETELAEQGEVVRGFLVDLLDAFGLDGEVTATPAEEGAVELAVAGDDLGPADRPEGRHPAGGPGAVAQRAAASAARRGPRPHPGGRRAATGPAAGRRSRRFVRTVAEDVRDVRRPEGARADVAARPQGRPRHGQRDRRRPHDLGGRGPPPPGRDHPRRLTPGPVDPWPAPGAAGARAACWPQLERARALGFLGPGPGRGPHRARRGRSSPPWTAVTGTVVDLGSGGGVPGLIVGVARPDLHLVLVDATAKRCRFLEAAVRRLGLTAEVVEGRAEVVGHGPAPGHGGRRGRCTSFTKPATSVWTYASTISASTLPEGALPPNAVTPPAQAPAAGAAPPPPAAQAPPAVPPGIRFGHAIAAANGWLLVGKEIDPWRPRTRGRRCDAAGPAGRRRVRVPARRRRACTPIGPRSSSAEVRPDQRRRRLRVGRGDVGGDRAHRRERTVGSCRRGPRVRARR